MELLELGQMYAVTIRTRAQRLAQEQTIQLRNYTEEVETYSEAKECDSLTFQAEQEADHLSKEEVKESSDLAEFFPFIGDVITVPEKRARK